jgi:hypothetical protein
MIKKEGISVPFEFDKFKPFTNEYKPEPKNKTKSMFIDDEEESEEVKEQRKIDPFVVSDFKMTKDIEFFPKNNRPPYVRPNRGIIASINISNLIKYCNEKKHPYHEFDSGNLNDNTELIILACDNLIRRLNQVKDNLNENEYFNSVNHHIFITAYLSIEDIKDNTIKNKTK